MPGRTLTPAAELKLVAVMNDLIKLDNDAIQSYDLAIRLLSRETDRRVLRRFRTDHERHIDQLAELVLSYGGAPIDLPHVPSGPFKLAMQGLGVIGGDRAVLLAFKANERQARDKYQRMSRRKGLPGDVAAVLRRNARDEERHYRWAVQRLESLGIEKTSPVAVVERAVEVANARVADAVEGVERQATLAAEGVRRGAKKLAEHPVATGAAIVGAGAAIAAGIVAIRKRK